MTFWAREAVGDFVGKVVGEAVGDLVGASGGGDCHLRPSQCHQQEN